MARIDYSRTTLKLTELESRISTLEQSFTKAINKIMIRVDNFENTQNENKKQHRSCKKQSKGKKIKT